MHFSFTNAQTQGRGGHGGGEEDEDGTRRGFSAKCRCGVSLMGSKKKTPFLKSVEGGKKEIYNTRRGQRDRGGSAIPNTGWRGDPLSVDPFAPP